MNNKDRNGFTLVELLAVIVVLAIITTIGAMGVSSVINTSKTKAYDQQVANIIKAAEQWALENTDKLPSQIGKPVYVRINYLVKNGYLPEHPQSPITSSTKIYGYILIECTTNCVSYNYSFEKKTTGPYLKVYY